MAIIFGYARRAQDLALFTRHLEGAMRAKAPLAEVMATFSAEADTRAMQRAVAALVPRIEAGAALSEAMADAPHVFPESYRRVIHMGEQSQTLPSVVGGLAAALEEGISLHEQIRRAAVYPAIVLFILLLEISFISWAIQNNFSQFAFADFYSPGANPVTRTMIGWNLFVFPLLTLLLLCLLWLIAAGTGVVWNSYRKGKLVLSLPLIGPALRLSETARFIRHLGLMLENRVPLGEAVGLLADSTVNGYVQAALHDFQQRLQSGENLGSVISSQPVFPPALAVMLSSAQERGHLSETMLHLGGFYRERAIHALRIVREFFEPFMLVLVGFFIAWIALGFYIPLMSITRMTSSGY